MSVWDIGLSRIDRASDAIRDRVGTGGADVIVVARSEMPVSAPPFRQNVEAAIAGLRPHIILGAITPWNPHQPGLVSNDGHAIAIPVTLAGTDDKQRSQNLHWLK